MKTLKEYISQVKELHSLNEYIREQLDDSNNVLITEGKFWDWIKSLEEFNISEIYSNLKDLYSFIKKSKIMYRFPLNLCDLKSFRFKSSLVYQLI